MDPDANFHPHANVLFNPRRTYQQEKYIHRSQIGDAEEWLNSRKKQLLTVVSLPATGKTWFLRCFFYLLQNKYGASVKPLWVQVDDLISQENEEADLNYSNEPLTQLTDASKKAWFSQFYEQLKEQCSSLPPKWDGSTSNVSDALEQLIEQLHRYCFSGRQIVLFIDNSDVLSLDSWREFEQTILDPIARKKELRLVVALREDQRIRSYILRTQQQHLFLGDFSEEQHRGEEQIERLSQEFTAVAPQVAKLLQQVPTYDKTHPGINTFLFLYAEKHGNIDISLTFLQHMLKALNPYHSCEIDELISLLSDIADYKNEWVIEEFAKWLKVSNTVALAQSQKLIDNHLVINIAYNRFKVVDGVREFVRCALNLQTAVSITTTVQEAERIARWASESPHIQVNIEQTDKPGATELHMVGPTDETNRVVDKIESGRTKFKFERAQLRRLISDHFNTKELQVLCFDLELEFESITTDTKMPTLIVIEIIKYCQRHGRYADLLTQLREERPHIDWPF